MNSRPSQEIRNELIHAKLEREELGTPPLVIPQDALVQRLTTEALVAMPQDQPQARSDLCLANIALRELKDKWATIGQLNGKIEALTEELKWAETQEALALRADAAKRAHEAIEAFKYVALDTARAYRRMINANPTLDSHTARFDIGALMPMSWQGSLGEAMRQGSMPWEDK